MPAKVRKSKAKSKKKSKPKPKPKRRRETPDFAQQSLAMVERIIGGKLSDGTKTNH